MKKLTLLILTLALLCSTAFAQLDYGPQASDKEAAVRMHFAIRLFRGGLTDTQEALLLRGIRDRRSINEDEASRLFTVNDLKHVFFGIGREDVSIYRSMFEAERIPEKKLIWEKLTRAQQVDARRINFAWGVGYLNLSDAQIDFLVRFSKKLPTVTRDELDIFQTEAEQLFPREGKLLFGSIGPYTPCRTNVLISYRLPTSTMLQPTNCPCSIGSKFNMSCDGDCTAPGALCTVTPDGCGFAWLYSCTGFCVVS